ncbi:hypothetical protein GCM10025787_16120 [Saccharopolyspora rosea]
MARPMPNSATACFGSFFWKSGSWTIESVGTVFGSSRTMPTIVPASATTGPGAVVGIDAGGCPGSSGAGIGVVGGSLSPDATGGPHVPTANDTAVHTAKRRTARIRQPPARGTRRDKRHFHPNERHLAR